MSAEFEPPRLLDTNEGVSPELARALLSAKGRVPSLDMLAVVAARFPPGPVGGGTEGSGDGGGGVDPPAGGESGTGVDPPAGGEGGAGVDPPAGGENGARVDPPLNGGALQGGALQGGALQGGALAKAASVWSAVLVGGFAGVVVGAASLLVPVSPSAPDVALVPSIQLSVAAPSPGKDADNPRGIESAPSSGAAASPPSAPASSAAEGTASTTTSSAAAPTDSATSSVAPEEPEADYLRRAHSLLGSSPREALTLAEAHPLAYPKGKLGQEREMIVIAALKGLGRTAEAEARGAAFLGRFPESAYRRRIEALVPSLSNSSPTPSPPP